MATKQEKRRIIPVTKGSRNVFAELGFAEADELQLKADHPADLSPNQGFWPDPNGSGGPARLKATDVSKLMQGKFTGFSTDRLLALEVDVEIILRPRSRKPEKRGTVRVLAEVG